MKVFLSWSGDRSHAVAETLGGWLEQVIQAVEPWISSGIAKGARWQAEVVDKLEEAKVGIVCLTSSNLTAPWILFEAGALSKTKGSYVCTFLLDVAPAGIEPPLGQFQHTVFEKDDVRQLVETINKAIQAKGERSLNEQTLASVFEKFWPDLDLKLKAIAALEEEKPVQRSERALLEEMLEILRSQEQRRLEEIQSKVTWKEISAMLDKSKRAEPNAKRTLADLLLAASQSQTVPRPKRTLSDIILEASESESAPEAPETKIAAPSSGEL